MSRLIGGIIIGYLIYLVIRKVAQSLVCGPKRLPSRRKSRSRMCWSRTRCARPSSRAGRP